MKILRIILISILMGISLQAVDYDDFVKEPEQYLPEIRHSQLLSAIFQLSQVDLNLRTQLVRYVQSNEVLRPSEIAAVCILSSADCARGLLGNRADLREIQEEVNRLVELLK